MATERGSRISNFQYMFSPFSFTFKGCKQHLYTRSALKLSLFTEKREEQHLRDLRARRWQLEHGGNFSKKVVSSVNLFTVLNEGLVLGRN
jgi:hypothetical protein